MEVNNTENVTYYYYYYYTGEDLIRQCHVEDFSTTTGASLIIIFCLSFLGNATLLFGLIRFENIRRVTMLFLLCLAGFDVLFTLTLPFWAVDYLHQWIFGEFACQILTGAYFVGIYGSLILLTAMTVDRFFVIVVRSQWLTRRRRQNCARAAIVGTWIISIGGCMKDALASRVLFQGNFTTCNTMPSQDDKPGYYTQLSLLFVIPVIIIILCYSMILHTLMSTSGRRKYWSVLVILAIVVAFVICWGPYHILMIIMGQLDQKNCDVERQHNRAFLVCRILAYSHCCVNPLLFLLRERFRRILSSFLFCSPRLRSSSQQEEPSEPSHPSFYQRRASIAYQQNDTELKTLRDS
ncbi:chemokine XC receptor 1 [Trichomycterus rosablanca]|uniref:chemokine XC receptor 1 n=1 Tax=Trichomycterus rosablanca TaxID=2290929 RepID=UPI002F3578A2